MHVTDNSIINALVLRAAFEKIKHLIMLSCTVMYRSSNKPISEKDYKENQRPYDKYFGGAWMKVYMEKTAEFFSKLSNVSIPLSDIPIFMALTIIII